MPKKKQKKPTVGEELILGLEEVVQSLKHDFRRFEIVAYNGDTYGWLKKEERVVFLGLIPNAPGHCVVAKHNGVVLWMVHPEDFRRLDEDEL